MIREELFINDPLCWGCDPQSHLLHKKEKNPTYQSELHMTRTCMTQDAVQVLQRGLLKFLFK